MPSYRVIDTFPAFERFWAKARMLPVREQIELWRHEYLRPWPELLENQVENYVEAGADWRTVAKRRVFPTLDQKIPRMRRVRSNLRRAIPFAVRRCRTRLGMRFPVTFVLHVGVGCGAGWATTFRRDPAVLFGLENATGVHWTDSRSAVALVEHELSHLVHARWRRRAKVADPGDPGNPWWQLYEEGFATRCEFLLSEPGEYRSAGRGSDWLPWCDQHRARLAALFLRTTKARGPHRRFFGSWYDVDGHIETGYYLGSELIREWQSRSSLKEIACWTSTEIRRRGRSALRRMAQAG